MSGSVSLREIAWDVVGLLAAVAGGLCLASGVARMARLLGLLSLCVALSGCSAGTWQLSWSGANVGQRVAVKEVIESDLRDTIDLLAIMRCDIEAVTAALQVGGRMGEDAASKLVVKALPSVPACRGSKATGGESAR